MTEIRPGVYVLLAFILAGLALWFAAAHLRKRRRARLMTQPLSDERRQILERRLPVYRRLPEGLRARLEGLVNAFLDDVKFHGAEGLEVTEEMRTLIAAQASLLVLGRPERRYETLRTVLLYPSAYRARFTGQRGGLHVESEQARSGESWTRGPVILSWADAAAGAANDRDGRNVVYHEFAHQLDQGSGAVDGAPLLARDQSASGWARVFQDAYGRMLKDVEAGLTTVLNPYGATHPAEFFAVATETFFERPEALKREEPALYAELAEYYALDPAAWP